MEEILLTSWYGKYTIIYMVLYILGGAGFLPSKVVNFEAEFNAFFGGWFPLEVTKKGPSQINQKQKWWIDKKTP